MAEHVYTIPDLTTNVRYGRREQEMEERGEREEMIVDIYVSADDLDPDPDPGTQQNAVQQNTTQEQHGGFSGSDESKNNRSRAAVVCLGLLGLLCVILLAVIIGLVKHNSKLIQREKNLDKDLDQMTGHNDELQARYDNLTEHNDELKYRYDNLTEHNDELKYRYDNLTKHNDELQSIYDKQKYQYGLDLDHLQSRFDHLQSRYNEVIKRDDIKRILCESNRFTFGGGLCYYISTEKKTWEQSRQYCRDRQSDLIVIKSNDQKDLVDKVIKNKESMWLGLTDLEVGGVWKWVDGTPLTTPTYWNNGEPNKYPGEDCVEVYNGRWNDKSCSFQNRWLCERVI